MKAPSNHDHSQQVKPKSKRGKPVKKPTTPQKLTLTTVRQMMEDGKPPVLPSKVDQEIIDRLPGMAADYRLIIHQMLSDELLGYRYDAESDLFVPVMRKAQARRQLDESVKPLRPCPVTYKHQKLGLQRQLPREVLRIARRVRQEVLEENNGSSWGMCVDASWRLRDLLRKAGFPCRVCNGVFNTGWDGFGEEGHYWVRFNRAILDVTADQFNEGIEEFNEEMEEEGRRCGKQTKMAAIVYGTSGELERRYRENRNESAARPSV
jgi:hypothetical protein